MQSLPTLLSASLVSGTIASAVSAAVLGLLARAEGAAPIQPIKLFDSKERTGRYVANTALSGRAGLPLHVTLHGSGHTPYYDDPAGCARLLLDQLG